MSNFLSTQAVLRRYRSAGTSLLILAVAWVGKDSFRAAFTQDKPSSVTSFTASWRNSLVYLPCGMPFN